MPDAIDIWRNARELVRWRGTDAPQYVAQKAAEACDGGPWAFWIEVERAFRRGDGGSPAIRPG